LRTYYIRRKDLSHVPFQFYVFADGTERPVDKGFTSTFAVSPPKGEYDVVHVHIVDAFARTLIERWNVPEADLVRVAATALETWVKGEPIPPDHYYGPDFLKLDQEWYPAASDGSPLLALDPYTFVVVVDEPYLSVHDWPFFKSPANGNSTEDSGPAELHESEPEKRIVFGFTADVFPGQLILGYHQFKNKVTEAGIRATVSMLSLGDLPPALDVLFVPRELAEAAAAAAPYSRIVVLDIFQNHPVYNSLIEELSHEAGAGAPHGSPVASPAGTRPAPCERAPRARRAP
jgi:hypothetical protein